MPFVKINFTQPIVLNKNYLRSIPGILKFIQCICCFISFLTIWLSCRSNYDPYLGTYSGFVGGDLETIALLIDFKLFFMTTLILATYYFSIFASTIIPKTVFEFVYNLLAFISQLIISICLLEALITRNNRDDGFPAEPGLNGKITSSVCDEINLI
ncbi:hypothetical protein BLA29_003303 [Euroglyphus maynei]|uniref:MARVEL domain-containing protein n=1 Tax=Euroglyphus maynei TaxID=6958 RepID=A0A1Y3ASX0_EURMA|nr:hypothetical protein BLA29_003303 [Euroglyphus maynei]